MRVVFRVDHCLGPYGLVEAGETGSLEGGPPGYIVVRLDTPHLELPAGWGNSVWIDEDETTRYLEPIDRHSRETV